jgi:hypothetical protein
MAYSNTREATCPACGHHVAAVFFGGRRQPLATIAWPKTAEEAEAMERLPLDFVRCLDCGHVFNAAFEYRNVPYSEKPNLMYNKGRIWAEYIRAVQRRILELLPEKASVVEIGYGDGSFLSALAEQHWGGQFVGFDPNGSPRPGTGNLVFHQELFDPARHMPELRPDLIISRHVLEHLMNPLGFLQTINFHAAALDLRTRMYFEVPCIDNALAGLRTVDFYYEHNSQFTSRSFRRMLELSGARAELVDTGYGGEVIYSLVQAEACSRRLRLASEAMHFAEAVERSETTVGLQLASLAMSGKRVAVWGGTGKSAAFINHYGLDRSRFPLVVDSDPEKAGTCVPGTGQLIRHRDCLLENPAQVILIPPQWRAADIVREMRAAGIRFEVVLIEHNGMLVDFFAYPHPYRLPADAVQADAVADPGLVGCARDLERHVASVG